MREILNIGNQDYLVEPIVFDIKNDENLITRTNISKLYDEHVLIKIRNNFNDFDLSIQTILKRKAFRDLFYPDSITLNGSYFKTNNIVIHLYPDFSELVTKHYDEPKNIMKKINNLIPTLNENKSINIKIKKDSINFEFIHKIGNTVLVEERGQKYTSTEYKTLTEESIIMVDEIKFYKYLSKL